MRTRLLLFSIPILLFAACNGTGSPIEKKWQAQSIEDRLFDQLMKEQAAFLDTLGTHTTAAENMELYMTNNVDSLHDILLLNMKEAGNKQKEKVAQLWYHFMSDSILVMHTRKGTDTAKWYFDTENILLIEANELAGMGNPFRLEILTLTDTLLRLQSASGNNSITTTFVPAAN